MNIKTVSVFGLGYIGLPTATVIARQGVNVIGVDVCEHAVNSVNAGQLHIIEPELGDVLKNVVQKGHLRAALTPEPADAFLVAVPTPFKEGHKPDLSYIQSVAKSLAPVLRKGNLVILESTSPVGTTERMADWLSEARPDLTFPQQAGDSADIQVAYCPERVLPGKVLHELVNNDRVIGGMSAKASEMATEVYRLFVKGTLSVTNSRTAEMCKLTENTFRDINIAYANELSKVCDRLGIDVFKLIELANCHPRVNVHSPGVGVGGHCIAVDPWFIHEKFEDITPLIYEARLVNDGKPAWTADRIARDVKPGAKIAVLGMSFKANIDDTRESPSVLFANILKARGYEVLACEPYIRGDVAGYHNYSLAEAMAQCDYAVITLMHNIFKENKALIASKPYYDCVGLMEK